MIRLGKYWKDVYKFFSCVGNSEQYYTEYTCKFCGMRLPNDHGREDPQPIICDHLTQKHDFILSTEPKYPHIKLCRECEAPLVKSNGEDQACLECILWLKAIRYEGLRR